MLYQNTVHFKDFRMEIASETGPHHHITTFLELQYIFKFRKIYAT